MARRASGFRPASEELLKEALQPRRTGEAMDAGRTDDAHDCPCHGGGPLRPPSRNVKTNFLMQAAGTDPAECTGGPSDFIVTGSSTVKVNGQLASRFGDKTMHEGSIKAGSGTVKIGGATAGVTLGDPLAGQAACGKASGGRTSGATKQSYNNCGIESSRLIIEQSTGKSVKEDDIFQHSIDKKYTESPGNVPDPSGGGTTFDKRQKLLSDYGVSSSTMEQTPANLQQAIAEKKGVISAHKADVLWNNTKYAGNFHAISPTGVRYDQNGKVASYIMVDSGQGNCWQEVPAGQFHASLRDDAQANVTNAKVW